MFLEARSFIASRIELLPASRRLDRIDSFGSLSPGYKFSSKISEIMSSEIFWGRLFSSDAKFII